MRVKFFIPHRPPQIPPLMFLRLLPFILFPKCFCDGLVRVGLRISLLLFEISPSAFLRSFFIGMLSFCTFSFFLSQPGPLIRRYRGRETLLSLPLQLPSFKSEPCSPTFFFVSCFSPFPATTPEKRREFPELFPPFQRRPINFLSRFLSLLFYRPRGSRATESSRRP